MAGTVSMSSEEKRMCEEGSLLDVDVAKLDALVADVQRLRLEQGSHSLHQDATRERYRVDLSHVVCRRLEHPALLEELRNGTYALRTKHSVIVDTLLALLCTDQNLQVRVILLYCLTSCCYI